MSRFTTEPTCHACGHLATSHSGRPDGENDACTTCDCPRLHMLVTVNAEVPAAHVYDDSCPANDYHYRTGASLASPPTPVRPDVSDLADAGHAAVYEALAALPIQSWVLVLSAMRGLSQTIGDTLNDDPTADYALTRACDAEIDRLTQRRKKTAEASAP